jgi:hypothetical protein
MGSSKNREKDAHVWWSYVWHELKRQHADELAIKDRVGKFECSQGEDAMVKLSSLKANLSAQAIEIASLRQELLGRKLSYRTEVESLKEQLDLANRESLRLNSLIRTHRGDKETRRLCVICVKEAFLDDLDLLVTVRRSRTWQLEES